MARGYSKYAPRIEKALNSDVITILRRLDPGLTTGTSSRAKLGEIRDFGTIATVSQAEGRPMKDVSAGTPDQKRGAKEAFLSVAHSIIASIASHE
jgi:hypothetical protein